MEVGGIAQRIFELRIGRGARLATRLSRLITAENTQVKELYSRIEPDSQKKFLLNLLGYGLQDPGFKSR